MYPLATTTRCLLAPCDWSGGSDESAKPTTFAPLSLVLFLFDFYVDDICKKTILTYQIVKNANDREKVGEQGEEEMEIISDEKTYSGCG